jgi:uncharacterized phiE125 gp8 family phage protein
VYGSPNLTASPAQSFTEPLSLEDAKSYLGLASGDGAHDNDITAMLPAAREQAEILQGRDLVRKQWDLSFDYWRAYEIRLGAPLVSVDLVQYRDFNGAYTALVENTDYVVDTAKQPGIILPAYNRTWPSFTPWPTSSILVRFTSGMGPNSSWWADAGARVKHGMKLLISHWFNGRLPFVTGAGAIQEYPFTVSSCLSFGQIPRVR